MRKEKKNFIKLIIALLASFTLLFGSLVTVSAEESENFEVGDVLPEEMAPDYNGGNSEEENGNISNESGEDNSTDGKSNSTDTGDTDGENHKTSDNEENIFKAPNSTTAAPGSNGQNAPSGTPQGEKNLFEELYHLLGENADKILAGLAFIGTLVVGLAYKSGLMPLLRDALSKLKAAIDRLYESSELAKISSDTDLSHIKGELVSISNSLDAMKWQYESYDSLCLEREKHKRIMLEQIDMLYAIFMASALPQYQKEEVGEKIKKMREELSFYESTEEI